MKTIKDGIIKVDTERGDRFDFKSAVFSDSSYMFKKGDSIYMSTDGGIT